MKRRKKLIDMKQTEMGLLISEENNGFFGPEKYKVKGEFCL